MAPPNSAPPAAAQSLSQRLLALAQTLQFGWFVGHVTLLLCTLRYGLSYITFNYYSGMAKFTYRTTFLAAAVTYGIVVYKALRARQRQGAGNHLVMLADENVQYLVMALVWLFSRQVPLAMVPFSVYSFFHFLTYTRTALVPLFAPPAAAGTKPKSGLSDTIAAFVKTYYDLSMNLVAVLEVGLLFRVFLSAMTFTKGSWILLGIYTVFLNSRFKQSPYVNGAIVKLGNTVDAQLANQGYPPALKSAWSQFKGIAKQASDMADVKRYVGPQTAAKKPQ